MAESYRELGFPSGWYAVARSSEIARGGVAPKRLCGRALALFRTESGALHATDAYCPHAGAHLGHVGSVAGEELRCGFHGFRFRSDGTCAATGYRSDARPPRVRLTTWPVRELHGLVFLWADTLRRAPLFQLPDDGDEGWSDPGYRRIDVRGHPEDVVEQGVDIGHFAFVHGFDDMRCVMPITYEGYSARARYTGRRRLGPSPRTSVEVRFDTTINTRGLGYTRLDGVLGPLRLRHIVCATPVDMDRLEIFVGSSVSAPSEGRPAWLRLAPLRWLATNVLARVLLGIYHRDVLADVPVMAHKAYARRPVLVPGDGPILAYRRWARRFYPAPHDTDTTPDDPDTTSDHAHGGDDTTPDDTSAAWG
jgi:nitrite reductase/ring-hydroxylating ferredoxin subunit